MRRQFSSLLLSSLLLSSFLLSSLGFSATTLFAQQGTPVATPAIDPTWMSFDTATKRVTFALTAGLTPFNGALNFNGFRDGELTLVVPTGWNVVVNFENHDGMLPHSAEVILDDGSTPLRPVGPAIQRAYTRDLETGVEAGGGKDVMRFGATPVGNYRFYCAVPGHGAAGMWIRLKVDATVTAPRMVLSPKSAGR
jgi:hypothetical protein